MAKPKKINLGVFAAGELPLPVLHTFRYSDGTPISLTGYTLEAYIEGPEEIVGVGSGSINIQGDPDNGQVSYEWVDEDFYGIGKHQMLLWVIGPNNRYASDLIVYDVFDGPGPNVDTD